MLRLAAIDTALHGSAQQIRKKTRLLRLCGHVPDAYWKLKSRGSVLALGSDRKNAAQSDLFDTPFLFPIFEKAVRRRQRCQVDGLKSYWRVSYFK
jgi:hypothetical protein